MVFRISERALNSIICCYAYRRKKKRDLTGVGREHEQKLFLQNDSLHVADQISVDQTNICTPGEMLKRENK